MAKVPAKTKTRKQWVAEIKALSVKTAASLIELGKKLIAAKAALPHGEFGRMLDEVRMNARFAQRLMAVARSPRFKPDKLSLLPPTLSALSELARASEEEFERGIADGRINPRTMAREVRSVTVRTVAGPPLWYAAPSRSVMSVDPVVRQGVPRHVTEPESSDPVATERMAGMAAFSSALRDLLDHIGRLNEPGLDLMLAEIKPRDRETLGTEINEAIAALMVLRKALVKQPIKSKVA